MTVWHPPPPSHHRPWLWLVCLVDKPHLETDVIFSLLSLLSAFMYRNQYMNLIKPKPQKVKKIPRILWRRMNKHPNEEATRTKTQFLVMSSGRVSVNRSLSHFSISNWGQRERERGREPPQFAILTARNWFWFVKSENLPLQVNII